ncbi:MAG: bifunctional UDP-N-acetylglucosamine diphosphorylase/glucosamine-1-phosphate N-acetyltransferase GlmU [Alphaproteobacteria bacterium]|nr:bifunctional UDP-N-acetylglucosamine diphosphorylase/glucosamine-1-phosphate N-acetyltransferase GlmU [Alphaproteobacteria bacterium]
MKHNIATLILAAGWGTRMQSNLPKVLHKVAHQPLLSWVLNAAETLAPVRQIVVVRPGMDQVKEIIGNANIVLQEKGEGTGAAVMAARPTLEDFKGDVLVLFGDTPFITPETLQCLVETRRSASNPAVVIVGFKPEDPAEYGRIVMNAQDQIERIVEYKDANDTEREIGLCNSGVMAIDGSCLFELVDKLTSNNAKGEYYLTDIIEHARKMGRHCTVVEASEEELMGINSRADLARAELEAQTQLRGAALAMGVTLIDPDSVYLSYDTNLGKDITIGPNVVIMPGVEIRDNVIIHAFCHLEGARIEEGAIVGPFARLRPGTEIGRDVRIGNFVEVKNSQFEAHSKANHLSYIGDAHIGKKSNIGAGTITCNYDGINKSKTILGENVFIGSNSALVAPVQIGNGAIVAAGSVVTNNVAENALCIARSRQIEKPNGAQIYREQHKKERSNVTLMTVVDNDRPQSKN